MSFAAGIGAGIACGIGCGIAAGERRARTRIEEHVGGLRDAGEIRILDRAGHPASLDALLDGALAPRESDRKRVLFAILLLGGVAVLGVIVFFLLRG